MSPTASNSTRSSSPPAAWLVPGAVFVVLLWLMWPRPYTIPPGDGLTYYSGARHIALEGRYFHDNDRRPAVPLTRHPPLFSLMWGGLMAAGLKPVTALAGLHAVFLFIMGAAGGALAYRATASWIGPLLWTVLSAAWPGGDNWLYWIRPMTESATAAAFVVVCWLLCNALRSDGGSSTAWFLSAAAVAGLSAILKITGVLSFPAVVVTGAVLLKRGTWRLQWWVLPGSLLLLTLPYGAWALRNWTLTGAIESGKISHHPLLVWELMRQTAASVSRWFLPSPLAATAAENLHPALIMAPLVLGPVLLGVLAWRRRALETLIPAGMVFSAYAALAVMMVTKFTEEARYWSVLLPCYALAVLVLRPPRHALAGLAFRLPVTLFALFCCGRFAVTRPELWSATAAGFYVQQGLLAAALIAGVVFTARLLQQSCAPRQSSRPALANLVIMILCAVVAVSFWRFAHPPAPLGVFLPLAFTGALLGAPRAARTGVVLRRLAPALAAIAASWWLGGWQPAPEGPVPYFERDGVLVRARDDVLLARRWIGKASLPAKFVSNAEEYFVDLFGDYSVLPLPWYHSIARFRSGLPQLPEHERQVKRAWLEQLCRAGVTDPFAMIILPEFKARTYCYGPSDLEHMENLRVEWKVRLPDLHIAVCQLLGNSPSNLRAVANPARRPSSGIVKGAP